jgi:hypothetical protein
LLANSDFDTVNSVGLLDGLLGRAQYTPSPVEIEGVIGRWTSARMAGTLAAAGGEVYLTHEYVVFTPWDLSKMREWLVKLLTGAGVPHVGDLNKLLSATKLLEPLAIPINQIATVQPMGRASLLRPPWARITFTDGRHLDLGILASPRYPSLHPANNAAFDDWLGKLRALLPAGVGA